MSVLTTPRLQRRPWREPDLDPFARLNADPAVMEFMARRLSRDESDALAARAQADIARRGWGLWAAPTFDAHFTPCIEIGWRLAREQWGHGYGTDCVVHRPGEHSIAAR